MTTAPQKIVILGGGASALTVAWALTSQPDWRQRYGSITVYQQGWRLGGKGASGRGPDGRIEEHGLHVWMGWYQNAFRIMREAYAELGRPAGAPLANWDDAFKRHGFIDLGEQVNGQWTDWPLEFPITDDTPGSPEHLRAARSGLRPWGGPAGSGGEFGTLADYIDETLQSLHRLLNGTLFTAPSPPAHGLIERLLQSAEHVLHLVEDFADIAAAELLLHAARGHSARLRQGSDPQAVRGPLVTLLRELKRRLLAHTEAELDGDTEARRLFIIADVGLACVAGVLERGLEMGAHALDAIDHLDFRAFLRESGALDTSTESSLVRAFYDLLFAYRDGNPDDQRVAAGVALRFIFRMVLTYKGAIFWKMQAGMGDTVFTPLHQVLERRGVQFKFFHRVRNLELSPDKTAVERIHVGRQATLRDGDVYRPYIDVKGLPCWPNRPLYEQLVEGDELKAQDIDLESMWSPWVERETPRVLERGRDFDLVVFGISIASIPYVAAEPLAASAAWQASVAGVETVRTQAAQLWLRPTQQALGWTLPSAVTDAYPEPLDTWADMTHLLPREDWAADATPGTLTYFCAPMPGGIPPLDDRAAPAREDAQAKANALQWVKQWATVMWPQAADPATPGRGFDWSLLVAPASAQGQARFDAQYWRANIDPSERYVLSVPGSTALRLRADRRDFTNLFVTGDWIYTGVNAGCVEGTVMSGLLTANAIGGVPALSEIVGYDSP
jgi:uncharacterized protein with NAD-binding domain and iron-sulfur cluster